MEASRKTEKVVAVVGPKELAVGGARLSVGSVVLCFSTGGEEETLRVVAPVCGDAKKSAFSSTFPFPLRGSKNRDFMEFAALAGATSGPSVSAALVAATAAWRGDKYDGAARAMVAAKWSDGLALVLGARARRHPETDEGLADAFRGLAHFGGDGFPRLAARAAASHLARSVATCLGCCSDDDRRVSLSRAFLGIALKYEPDEGTRAADRARLDSLLPSAPKAATKKKTRPPRWRRRLVDDAEAAEVADISSKTPRCTGSVVVVGLGTGRCGTTSLAALLSRCVRGGEVTHESTLPDCRVVLWNKNGAQDAYERRLRWWLRRDGPVVGDVNYAHLPAARWYLENERRVKIVALRRDRDATVRSFVTWTEPGGAHGGTLQTRDHWRRHDGDSCHFFDEWDLTFPKFDDAPSKGDAIARYYDTYNAALDALAADYGPDRVRIYPSPALFDTVALQEDLVAFLGFGDSKDLVQLPVLGLQLNKGSS